MATNRRFCTSVGAAAGGPVMSMVSIHNVRFYQRLVAGARAAILAGEFASWRDGFLAEYQRG